MRRRGFVAGIGGLAVAATVRFGRVGAQQRGSIPRVGYIGTASPALPEARWALEAWRRGLHELGYIEGENIRVDYRWAEGKFERLPAIAAELVGLPVDVIVAPNTPAARAARAATAAMPIVVQAMGDPVADGLVTSLASPGGNVTGSTFLGPELVPKRIELLKELLPGIATIAILWHPDAYSEQTTSNMLQGVDAARRAVGVEVRYEKVRSTADLDRSFAAIAAEPHDALFVFPSPMLFNGRTRVVELANRYGIPTIFVAREFVRLGGLMSYGASLYDLVRRSALFVDKIIKGAKPPELPVEQPTRFELAINLKTAKALGLTVPQSLVARADEVIE